MATKILRHLTPDGGEYANLEGCLRQQQVVSSSHETIHACIAIGSLRRLYPE